MKPPPKDWPRISSALAYDDAATAIDWLCRAFGFKVRLKVEGEGVTEIPVGPVHAGIIEPGHFRFSTLSAQGSYNQNHNSVTNVDLDTTQLLVLWTLTWNQKHTF